MKATTPKGKKSPSQLIDGRIKELGDWRGEMLGKLRAIVKAADPDVVEEWKWRGVPTWYHDGILFTGETYKAAVKMTFRQGRGAEGPRQAVQFQSGRQCAARHRLP